MLDTLFVQICFISIAPDHIGCHDKCGLQSITKWFHYKNVIINPYRHKSNRNKGCKTWVKHLTVYGEMSELAEGARLEIVCAAKSGTEGSNPSLSAIIFTGFQYVLFSSGTQIPSTNIWRGYWAGPYYPHPGQCYFYGSCRPCHPVFRPKGYR